MQTNVNEKIHVYMQYEMII